MLFRFCLYGFLKNQQYYDPFLILAFREKGLSFAAIGMLIGFREVCINILEIPTGAVADVVGRRRAMIFSFLAYIAAFLVFGFSSHPWTLFAAMFCFSVGEAFRTGTHKAIIFDWLSKENRSDEKTSIYGRTRSWSKLGSAVSVVLAAILVFSLDNYAYVFFFSVVPYAANIINFLSYPRYLDGPERNAPSLAAIAGAIWTTVRGSLADKTLRGLLAESMAFEGCHKVCKDYLQPLLKTTALAMPVFLGFTGRQRTALLVGGIYAILYVFAGMASRHAGAFAKKAGSEERGSRRLWTMNSIAFCVLTLGILSGFPIPAIAAFVGITVLQNFWRPILISRVAAHSEKAQMATLLSAESQAKSLFAAGIAPLLGLAVDAMPRLVPSQPEWCLLPVGALGVVIATVMALRRPDRPQSSNPHRR